MSKDLDSIRLDWLERKSAHLSGMSDGTYNVWVYGMGDFEGDTIREAIDKAMKGKRE